MPSLEPTLPERYDIAGVYPIPDEHLLKELQSEASFGPLNEEMVRHAYGVATKIATAELYGGNEEAGTYLEHVKYYAQPTLFEANEITSGAIGLHSETNSRLTIDLQAVKQSAEELARLKGADGQALVESRHAAVLLLLHTAAHEAGHSVLAGVSEEIKPATDTNSIRLRASRVFMQANPGVAFTGSFDTDTWIHEERFAEGYAAVVSRKALKTMGYTPEKIDEIITILTPAAQQITEEDGMHQIDHLDRIGGNVTAAQAMEAAAKEKGQTVSAGKYLGELGYHAGLSKQAVQEQLVFYSQLVQRINKRALDPAVLGGRIDGESWKEVVKVAQTEETQAILAEIKSRRVYKAAGFIAVNETGK